MILIIDNYDSFTYNLAQQFARLHGEVEVVRNDRIDRAGIDALHRSGTLNGIVISPGPGTPDQAGISLETVGYAADNGIPLLGVCLGHQCIAQYFGASIVRAQEPIHGKAAEILHAGGGLLQRLSRPFIATRYHSLVVDPASVPTTLEVTCSLRDGTIMGISHTELPLHGVQFHPESILTQQGDIIVKNFLNMSGEVDEPEVVRNVTATAKRPIDSIVDALGIVVDGNSLTESQAAAAMGIIMDGQATDSQVASLITMLRMKGETVEEIVGFANAMRDRATNVVTTSHDTLDIVGTGGDGLKTFNISTTSAFVVAGAGVPVAKHGNRAVSSASGAADVLEALGVDIDLTSVQMARCVNEVGIGFLFAQALHPSMKNAATPRREIAIRTVFNILGPLTNPAGANHQLLGTYDEKLCELLAEVAGRMGARHVIAAHGHPGMDEVSASGQTTVSEFHEGTLGTYVITPESYGIARGTVQALEGGLPAQNALITQAILEGEKGERRDVVLMNAGVALYAADKAADIAEGVQMARHSIDSGAAAAKLAQLKSFIQTLKAAQ